jgi:hypothetical protein
MVPTPDSDVSTPMSCRGASTGLGFGSACGWGRGCAAWISASSGCFAGGAGVTKDEVELPASAVLVLVDEVDADVVVVLLEEAVDVVMTVVTEGGVALDVGAEETEDLSPDMTVLILEEDDGSPPEDVAVEAGAFEAVVDVK